MNIKEIRQQYPQYNDLSDQQLADSLHNKFYSDLPKEQVYQKLGLTTPAAQGGEVNPPGTMVGRAIEDFGRFTGLGVKPELSQEGTMIGRAATQAVKDVSEPFIRAGKVALKGTVGGLVDLANISPQVVNLLPGTQGVQPITSQPALGTQQIEDVYQKLGGEYATAESPLGKAAEFVGEIGAGLVPLAKAPGLVQKTAEAVRPIQQALESIQQAPSKTTGAVIRGVTKGVGKTGELIERGVQAAREKTLSPAERALNPAARVVLNSIRASGASVDEALQRIATAKAEGIDLPLYAALSDRNLTTFAKSISQFGAGTKQADEAVKLLKEKQIPESIQNLLGDVSNARLPAEQASEVLVDMASNVFEQAKSVMRNRAAPIYNKLMQPKIEERAIAAIPGGPRPEEITKWNRVKSFPTTDDLTQWQAAQSRPAQPAGVRQLARWNQVKGADKLLNDDIGKSLKTDLRKNPAARDYLKKEYGLNDGMINSMPENSLPFIDALKREIDGLLDPLSTAKTSFEKSRLRKWKSEIVAAADEQYPAYANARKVYSTDAQFLKTLEEGPLGIIKDLSEKNFDLAGNKIMNLPPSSIKNLRNKFADSGIQGAGEAFEDGVVAYMQRSFDAMKDNRFQGFRNSVFGSSLQRERLAAALGPQKVQRLQKGFDVLDDAMKSLRLFGSDTASLQQARQALGEGGVNVPVHGGLINAARQVFSDAFQKNILDDPEGTQKLARYLFTPEGSELLEQIAKNPKLTQNDKLSLGTKIIIGAGATYGANSAFAGTGQGNQ